MRKSVCGKLRATVGQTAAAWFGRNMSVKVYRQVLDYLRALPRDKALAHARRLLALNNDAQAIQAARLWLYENGELE